MITCDIVIVDTGISTVHPFIKQYDDEGLTITMNQGKEKITYDIDDEIGHGTSIYGIIRKRCDDAKLYIIKVFSSEENEQSINSELLIHVLDYIYRNIQCKIINLSMGVKSTEYYNEIKDICDKLSNKGVIIVSAFDNDGTLSLPACLDTAIGVDSGANCHNSNDFIYVENSPINILAFGNMQRVIWKDMNYTMAFGCSYACAHVTALVYEIIKEKESITLQNVLEKIKEKSKCKYICDRYTLEDSNDNTSDIRNVALFPFSKEMHAFSRYSDMLSFKIDDIYDLRYSGRVGTKVSKLLEIDLVDLENDYEIKDIENISWEKIDTLVIGHTMELSFLERNRDIVIKVIKEALNKKIRVYLFDSKEQVLKNTDIDCNNSNIISYTIEKSMVSRNRFDRLYSIPQPVLGVFGTSSKQGKFSLQLEIKRQLQQRGYKIGHLGTEPTSLLFGCDEMYPMGYNSTIYVYEHNSISYVNELMHRISSKEKDLIIVGGQSGVVSMMQHKLSQFPCRQNNFLLATQPDAVVLCINAYDDVEYIERSINFLESLIDCKVIALVVFPKTLANDWKGMFSKKVKLDKDSYNRLEDICHKKFHLPLYRLGDINNMNMLAELIIDFF